MSNKPATWGPLAAARATLAIGGFDGAGVMLGDLGDGRFLVGKDWDLCRSPVTGEILAWARDDVARWQSYIEISPSGTGLKGYGLYSGVPGDGRKEITIDAPVPEGAGDSGHKTPEIGLYPGFDPRRAAAGAESAGRYFALTGMLFPGALAELRDVTAEFRRTQAEFERLSSGKAKRSPIPSRSPPPSSELPESVASLLAADPGLTAGWCSGAKIGPGADDSASGRDFSLALQLKKAGVNDSDIAAALRLYPHGQIGSGSIQGERASRRLARILAGIHAKTSGDDIRPVIRLAGGFLHAELERSEREIGLAGDVYQRGSLLVRVVKVADPASGAIRRAPGAVVITPYDRSTIRVRLTETIRFERFDKRAEQYVPVNAPADLADALLASAGQWPNIPALLGVVEAPTLRPDSTVLDVPGYDAATGLYFDDGGLTFPPIPTGPTRDEALAALETLKRPFAGMPFKAPADRSVALAATLTALTRRSMRAAPAFGFTAPKMGAGKTLTASVVSYIATGRAPAMMSQADDAESERKRLFAVLMEGASIAVIDNVERAFSSDALCSILTEPVFKDRVLGVSRTAAAPTCTTWCVTGNNLTVAGDLTTRTLVSQIDPECERPEEREFKVNLHEAVPRQRAELAVAALTVIRAFIAAGSPRPAVPTFGRFEQWQEWCRFPLIWLGEADPCATRAALEGRDPVRERLAELAESWHGVFGAEEVTLAAAVKEAVKSPPMVPTSEGDWRARLLDAMRNVAGERDGVNSRKLGWFLSKHEGRIEASRRFVRGEERRAGALWRVDLAAKGAGIAGIAGSQQPLTRECQIPLSDTYIETAAEKPRKPQYPHALADDLADDGILL